MTRLRIAFPAALLLLGGCMTIPSGIIDNFAPPQAQTVVTEVKTPICETEPAKEGESEGKAFLPCLAEVVTLAAGHPSPDTPNVRTRNRPRPPRMPHGRH
jgi:hypothetical protein